MRRMDALLDPVWGVPGPGRAVMGASEVPANTSTSCKRICSSH